MKSNPKFKWENEDFFVTYSPIHGLGLFTKKEIKEGETVLNWRPTKYLSEIEASNLNEDEKHYLNTLDDGRKVLMGIPDRYVNHSDDPNTIVQGDSDVASRKIKVGEEITSSYMNKEKH